MSASPKQKLTPTIDRDLLRESRKYALDHQTSVNELVRLHLKDLVEGSARHNRAAQRLQD